MKTSEEIGSFGEANTYKGTQDDREKLVLQSVFKEKPVCVMDLTVVLSTWYLSRSVFTVKTNNNIKDRDRQKGLSFFAYFPKYMIYI